MVVSEDVVLVLGLVGLGDVVLVIQIGCGWFGGIGVCVADHLDSEKKRKVV